MQISLQHNEKIYTGKVGFGFLKTANEKYKTTNKTEIGKNEDGTPKTVTEDVPGFDSIYEGLLNFEHSALVAFWDCALSMCPNRPTIEAIEQALEDQMLDEDSVNRAFSEAFKGLDNSGFFSKAVRMYWKKSETIKSMKSEDLPEDMKEMRTVLPQMVKFYEEREKRRLELNPEAANNKNAAKKGKK